MDLFSDILILVAATCAALYCMILSRRLRRFHQLDSGMGSAVAILSAQVDDLTRALDTAHLAARSSEQKLSQLTAQADSGAKRLELILASLHDLPQSDRAPKPRYQVVRRRHRPMAEAQQ